MMISWPQLVDPRLVGLMDCLVERAKTTARLTARPYCGYRDPAWQSALYAQGRRPVGDVNTLRLIAGLQPITTPANRIVTHARPGESRHNDMPATACDVVIVDPVHGELHWDTGCDLNADHIPDYEEIGRIGQELGLIWGGSWVEGKRDWGHFELAPGQGGG